MLSIQQMQYIVALSETRQFQKASEVCFVTQPTLSMQVKKAEETLGQFIFDRSKNPLELTSFGKSLIPILKEVLNENSKIELLKKRAEGSFVEQIKMAIIPTVATYLVPDLFGVWQKNLNGVQLMIEEMKTEEILSALENRSIDIGILAGPVHDTALGSIPLYKEEILAFAPGVISTTVDPHDLSNLHPWLLSKGNCLRTQMIQFCQIKNGTQSEFWNYEGGNIDLLIRMVKEQGGYTLVPEHFSIKEKDKKDLKKIFSRTLSSYPAREIIALVPNRSIKWSYIEKLIREVQHHYPNTEKDKLEVLNWNS